MRPIPSFQPEIQYWQQGIKLIAGLDEVGMGALAGPVCAAAVISSSETIKHKSVTQSKILTANEETPLIRDSKLMTPKQREQAARWIKHHVLAWAVGEAKVKEIDAINIRQASHLAMRRATNALKLTPEMLLVDGLPAQPHLTIPAVNIIDGDQLCWSIAAASIIAKVHRDKIMTALNQEFPGYGWNTNKGYGTPRHKTALREKGATIHHRQSYGPVAKIISR